jgi:flagellar basal-body rod protein FlgB
MANYLITLASQQAHWLGVRQAAIAGNVANANTPNYKAIDVEPFEETLANTQLSMAVTQPTHIAYPTPGTRPAELRDAASWDMLHSGNDVSLEQELLKSGEVNRAYMLNTSIVKTFNRLVIASSKG